MCIDLFSKMIESRVHSFRKAHLLMPQYFHISVRNLIKKGAFWAALKAISAHEIASNKEKAHFPFEDCMIFMTGVGVFDDILKIEHVLKCLMVFSKGAFSLKLCLRCKEQYQSHQICLGELFSCTRLCKGMLKKKAPFGFQKIIKTLTLFMKIMLFSNEKGAFLKMMLRMK